VLTQVFMGPSPTRDKEVGVVCFIAHFHL
jgi:hypothetical protein